jgi:hypothetical protein
MSMYKLLKTGCAAVVLSVGAFSGTAQGDLVLDLSTGINGTSPSAPTPWVTLDFHTVSTGDVILTATNHLSSSEFVYDVLLNVDPNINPASLTFSYQSGVQAVTVAHAGNDLYNGGANVKAGLFGVDLTYPLTPPGRASAHSK